MLFVCRIRKTVTAEVTISADSPEEAEDKYKSGDWESELELEASDVEMVSKLIRED